MVTAILIFIGFNLTFFPQFVMGYLGMPRRYHIYPEEFQIYHLLSTAGASVMGFGYLMMFIYLPWSLIKGKKAGQNPWPATGLEWEKAATPPVTFNFDGPVSVTEEPYCYHAKDDEFYQGAIEDPPWEHISE